MNKKKARLIAFYLPQYHPIPENDEWWGKGFTEWTNVVKAKPLYKGHYQPRIPSDLGFYDLRMPEVREAQAKMAKEAGVEGFMYWHYWFGNKKQLLQLPFEEVLKSGKPDFPFCLGWANHSWKSTTWNTKRNKNVPPMLMKQVYPGEKDFIDHFNHLLPAFKDPRYIRVDNKPFFLIYDVFAIPNLKLFMDLWNNLAKQNGLEGIHFVGFPSGMRNENRRQELIDSGVDAIVNSNITSAEKKIKGKYIGIYFQKFKKKFLRWGLEKYSYKDIIDNYNNKYDYMENIYPTVIPSWDRTPRGGKDATIFTKSTPKLFKEHLQKTIDIVKNKKSDEHKIIILRSWNEWGEGNYVEPDMKHGHGYLDAIKDVIFEK
jgi:lipopolysaccharide biosynthesis protein